MYFTNASLPSTKRPAESLTNTRHGIASMVRLKYADMSFCSSSCFISLPFLLYGRGACAALRLGLRREAREEVVEGHRPEVALPALAHGNRSGGLVARPDHDLVRDLPEGGLANLRAELLG